MKHEIGGAGRAWLAFGWALSLLAGVALALTVGVWSGAMVALAVHGSDRDAFTVQRLSEGTYEDVMVFTDADAAKAWLKENGAPAVAYRVVESATPLVHVVFTEDVTRRAELRPVEDMTSRRRGGP